MGGTHSHSWVDVLELGGCERCFLFNSVQLQTQFSFKMNRKPNFPENRVEKNIYFHLYICIYNVIVYRVSYHKEQK